MNSSAQSVAEPVSKVDTKAYNGYGDNFALYQEQVAKFKTPHGVQIGDLRLSIRFLVSPYNCAVKLCGRLTPHAFDVKGNPITYIDTKIGQVFDDNQQAIMDELASWIDSRPFPKLSINNPYFPGDTGNYGVNQFLYADSVDKEKYGKWYNSFPNLINILEKYGWAVHKGPEFYNCTYNHAASDGSITKNKESRVYILTPPRMVKLLKK